MLKRLHRSVATTPLAVVALLVSLAVLAGCSKEEMKQALDDATAKTKSLTESAVEAVEERLPETGSLQLDMEATGGPIKGVDLELISIGDGRPNVIQILTYDPQSNSRTDPTVMLHGTTDAGTASSLAGKTVQCDMYFRASSTAPIAMTKPGQSVDVTFESMLPEDNAVKATLGSASLIGSDDKPVTIRGGEIVAVVRGEE